MTRKLPTYFVQSHVGLIEGMAKFDFIYKTYDGKTLYAVGNGRISPRRIKYTESLKKLPDVNSVVLSDIIEADINKRMIYASHNYAGNLTQIAYYISGNRNSSVFVSDYISISSECIRIARTDGIHYVIKFDIYTKELLTSCMQ